MKKIEKLLLEAYHMGQDSVSYMKLINNGKGKMNICMHDEPCKCSIDQTTGAEDDMLKKLLSPPSDKGKTKSSLKKRAQCSRE